MLAFHPFLRISYTFPIKSVNVGLGFLMEVVGQLCNSPGSDYEVYCF